MEIENFEKKLKIKFKDRNLLLQSLTHKSFPFSVSSVMNKPIYFGGLSGKKFDWNIALNYSFDLFFEKKSISN